MKKNNIETLATNAIVDHMSKNPILRSDGFCLNDRFTEDYAYAESTLAYVYAGSVQHMKGMVNNWPRAITEPMNLPISDWLEIVEHWGTADSVLESGKLSAARVMWQTMRELLKEEGVTIPDENSAVAGSLNDLLAYETDFIKRLWDENTDLFEGTLALAVKSLTERKEKAPIMHWLYFLSASAGAARDLVNAMIPSATQYVCMETIYNMINE